MITQWKRAEHQPESEPRWFCFLSQDRSPVQLPFGRCAGEAYWGRSTETGCVVWSCEAHTKVPENTMPPLVEVFERCRFGERVSTCYHVPRCRPEPEGFGRRVLAEPPGQLAEMPDGFYPAGNPEPPF